MSVFNDRSTRECNDILTHATDNFRGTDETLGAVCPASTPPTDIAHLVSISLDYASWRNRDTLAAAIMPINTAPSAEAGQTALGLFAYWPVGPEVFDCGVLGARGLGQCGDVLHITSGWAH